MLHLTKQGHAGVGKLNIVDLARLAAVFLAVIGLCAAVHSLMA